MQTIATHGNEIGLSTSFPHCLISLLTNDADKLQNQTGMFLQVERCNLREAILLYEQLSALAIGGWIQ